MGLLVCTVKSTVMIGPLLIHNKPQQVTKMKTDIHPAYDTIKVVCSCGNAFETRSTLGKDLHVEICSDCHPFYTGQQKIVDTAGRVGKFQKKYDRAT